MRLQRTTVGTALAGVMIAVIATQPAAATANPHKRLLENRSVTYRVIGGADFDGDGKPDPAVFRPSTGTWYMQYNKNTYMKVWGEEGDIPVAADYDGDKRADHAVWRPSNRTFYVLSSRNGWIISYQLGSLNAIPVPGDFDGDGKADFAIYDWDTLEWQVVRSSSGLKVIQKQGWPEDVPVSADFDGDGRIDYALYKANTGTYRVINSSGGAEIGYRVHPALEYGQVGDLPAVADYNGDKKPDFGMFRAQTDTWYIRHNQPGLYSFASANSSYGVPVPNDWNNDGRADITVWRDGKWISAAGEFTLGQRGDLPI